MPSNTCSLHHVLSTRSTFIPYKVTAGMCTYWLVTGKAPSFGTVCSHELRTLPVVKILEFHQINNYNKANLSSFLVLQQRKQANR